MALIDPPLPFAAVAMLDSLRARPSLVDLERRRDALAARLAAVCADPDPWSCEGTRFISSLECSITRGAVTQSLLDDIEGINSQIREMIAPAHV